MINRRITCLYQLSGLEQCEVNTTHRPVQESKPLSHDHDPNTPTTKLRTSSCKSVRVCLLNDVGAARNVTGSLVLMAVGCVVWVRHFCALPLFLLFGVFLLLVLYISFSSIFLK